MRAGGVRGRGWGRRAQTPDSEPALSAISRKENLKHYIMLSLELL